VKMEARLLVHADMRVADAEACGGWLRALMGLCIWVFRRCWVGWA